jgi:GMP synthase PP-ATPase subunit
MIFELLTVSKHPFPGPGIAIRVLGEVTPERVDIARKADHIFISMIREAGLYDKISQAYAALDPSKAVGVMGDKRVYAEIIILRAVETTDCKLTLEIDEDYVLSYASHDRSCLPLRQRVLEQVRNSHHQRGPWCLPCPLRHFQQASCHH